MAEHRVRRCRERCRQSTVKHRPERVHLVLIAVQLLPHEIGRSQTDTRLVRGFVDDLGREVVHVRDRSEWVREIVCEATLHRLEELGPVGVVDRKKAGKGKGTPKQGDLRREIKERVAGGEELGRQRVRRYGLV